MPVITEPKKAAGALSSAVQEMERRYHLFAENNVRDIKSFNKLAATDPMLEKMPYIAIIIDELADLMMVVGKDVEDPSAGSPEGPRRRNAPHRCHPAPQRGCHHRLIKANIPSRIAFAVSSQVDSRTILDGAGAEKLLGQGDMLFMPVGAPKPVRIQGTFVRDEEISRVLDFIKQSATVQYDEAMIEAMEKHAIQDGKKGASSADADEETGSDPMLKQAVEVVIDAGQASTSLLQRRCKLGYARAARIMDEMEQKGIIGPYEGASPALSSSAASSAGNADESAGGIRTQATLFLAPCQGSRQRELTSEEHYGQLFPNLHRISSHQRADMEARGWDQLDFVVVGGDAYVDHPSFGTAIISRLLEAEGYKVGVLAQPRYSDCEDFKRFGRPKYGFFIGGGNVDSMVSHYSVAKIPRAEDEYSPGGIGGARPDRSATVYTRLAKEAYPDLPVILGGLEASLRRFAHYDYWLDTVLPSIAEDSGADLISFGMGEHQTVEIARRLAAGEPVESITDVDGTCYLTDFDHLPEKYVECAGFRKVASDKVAYARACRIQMDNQDVVSGQIIVQKQSEKYLVQNIPAKPLVRWELDKVYALPYTRRYHPIYESMGGVPAIREVQFSIIQNRGCFGGCNFCAIQLHQAAGSPAQCRQHCGRGRADDPRAGFQGLHPRYRRPHRQLPVPVLPGADAAGHVQWRQALPGPHHLLPHDRGPQRLPEDPAPCPGTARREKGVHPQRHPVRLPDG